MAGKARLLGRLGTTFTQKTDSYLPRKALQYFKENWLTLLQGSS